MKLTTFIIMIAILQVSASSFGQKVTMTQKQVTLTQVFKEIHKQTGYNVLWSASQIDAAKPIDVNFNNTSLKEALDRIFEGQPFTYEIDDKNVIVKEKETSFIDKVKTAFAQVTVTGKVNDELGNPMVGVTVREKGSATNATATDANGAYTITVADNKSVIIFSFVGFEPVELAARDIPQGSVIKLKATETSLREVVVNKGPYKEKQELSTGDVGILTAKEIGEQPVTDPIQALIGRIPGLVITQASGIPGAYATVRIRGQNSLRNGNDPLYIVDGVPFSSASLTGTTIGGAVGLGGQGFGSGMSPFNALNPADIEDIQVLKDADATAIYGSRGANGVILITTKKGKAGITKVNINASQGVSQVTRMMNLLNTQQYLLMRHEAFKNDGLPFPSITSNPSDGNYDVNGAWDTTRYTNWQKVLIGNTAHYTNIQANISGGNANTQFMIGAGYNRQTTVFPGDYEDRKGSVHVNLTHTSNDQKLHLTFTVQYVDDNSHLPQTDFTGNIRLAPDAPALYNKDGSLNWQVVNGTPTFFQNPLGPTYEQANSVTNNLISNLDFRYRILEGLEIGGNFGYNNDQMNQADLTPTTNVLPPQYANDPSQRSNASATTNFNTWIIEPQINYKRKIAKGSLNILLGTTFQQNVQSSVYTLASGFSSDALINNITSATSQSFGNTYTLFHYNALYGRVGYTWEDKYLLNITARRDGSSRFGPGNQWGNFGAIGTGWIFSKEKFINDNLPWLSFGKLRVSYGITGNDQTGDYQFLSTYTSQSQTYQGGAGLSPTQISNPNVGWETVKKLEFGMDLAVLKDRISLTASYFRDRTSNALLSYPLPLSSGFASVPGYNLPALLQNSGIEFVLNTANIKTGNFSWSSNVTVSLPQQPTLLSFPGLANTTFANVYVIGQSITISKRYQYTGVNPQTGVYTYTTANGTPSTTDKIFLPLPTKQFQGGFQNSFSYKGFSLDIFIQFVKQTGNNYLQSIANSGNFNGITDNRPTIVLQRWQRPGDNAIIGRFSTMGAQDPFGLLSQSNAGLSDASYIRVKNVAFSYQIPQSWQKAMNLENVKVSLQAQNLFTLTNYSVLDPETQGYSLPPLRLITLGLSATF